MKIMTIIFITVLAIPSMCSLVSALEERIELTTYYPSPGGRYEVLRADRMGVGATYGEDTNPAIPANVPIIVNDCVGIGAYAPQEKLEVRGNPAGATPQQRNIIRITNENAAGTYVAHSTIGHDANGPFMQVSNNANRWSIRDQAGGQVITLEPDTGDVGIGNTNPANNLDVTGGFRVYAGSGTSALRLQSSGVTAREICNAGGVFIIRDGITNATFLTINTAGCVGIGDAPSNSYRLRVRNGALYAQGGLIIHKLSASSEALLNQAEANLVNTAEQGQLWIRVIE